MFIYVKSKRLKHTLSLDTLIIRRKKQYVNLREYETRSQKLSGPQQEDLSSGFPTMQGSNQ